jgi:hypothetical protein
MLPGLLDLSPLILAMVWAAPALPARLWPGRRYGRAPTFIAVLVAVACRATDPAEAHERCDLALALALDVSDSTRGERSLVVGGTAAALRDPAVLAAAAGQRIQILVFAWAARPSLEVDWTLVAGPADLLAIATRLDRPALADIGNGTGLIWAVDYVRRRLAEISCDREIVDVLTDGKAVSPYHSVQRFDRQNQVINVLWVGSDPAARRMVDADLRFGHGAFVLEVDDYLDVERAMVRKLVIEIAARRPGPRQPATLR